MANFTALGAIPNLDSNVQFDALDFRIKNLAGQSIRVLADGSADAAGNSQGLGGLRLILRWIGFPQMPGGAATSLAWNVVHNHLNRVRRPFRRGVNH